MWVPTNSRMRYGGTKFLLGIHQKDLLTSAVPQLRLKSYLRRNLQAQLQGPKEENSAVKVHFQKTTLKKRRRKWGCIRAGETGEMAQ